MAVFRESGTTPFFGMKKFSNYPDFFFVHLINKLTETAILFEHDNNLVDKQIISELIIFTDKFIFLKPVWIIDKYCFIFSFENE